MASVTSSPAPPICLRSRWPAHSGGWPPTTGPTAPRSRPRSSRAASGPARSARVAQASSTPPWSIPSSRRLAALTTRSSAALVWRRNFRRPRPSCCCSSRHSCAATKSCARWPYTRWSAWPAVECTTTSKVGSSGTRRPRTGVCRTSRRCSRTTPASSPRWPRPE